jgi:hypothetical protein
MNYNGCKFETKLNWTAFMKHGIIRLGEHNEYLQIKHVGAMQGFVMIKNFVFQNKETIC